MSGWSRWLFEGDAEPGRDGGEPAIAGPKEAGTGQAGGEEAEGQLAAHPGMHEHLVVIEKPFQPRSLPPMAASSERADRSIRARSPSRMRSLILSRPDAARASATKSSANTSVVLMHINMLESYASVNDRRGSLRAPIILGDPCSSS